MVTELTDKHFILYFVCLLRNEHTNCQKAGGIEKKKNKKHNLTIGSLMRRQQNSQTKL